METFIGTITSPFFMLIYGLLTHFLKDLVRLQSEGQKKLYLIPYWIKFPHQSLIALVGAVAGYSALIETNQLSGLTAFGVGYMANSIADTLGKRTVDRFNDS